MADHYFSPDPNAPEQRHTMRVDLGDGEIEVVSANGVFSAQGLDKATRILLAEVPEPPASGTALDIGCGWGPITLSLARRSPELAVWAVDVNERALSLTEANASALGCANVTALLPDAIPDDLRFDVIWSNPPIRIGKAQLDALLGHWLPRLTVGGNAWLVVGKNLGADSLQRRLGEQLGDAFAVSRHATSGGFRVLRVERLSSGVALPR